MASISLCSVKALISAAAVTASPSSFLQDHSCCVDDNKHYQSGYCCGNSRGSRMSATSTWKSVSLELRWEVHSVSIRVWNKKKTIVFTSWCSNENLGWFSWVKCLILGADPWEGRPPSRGRQHMILPNFPKKNCMKLRKIWIWLPDVRFWSRHLGMGLSVATSRYFLCYHGNASCCYLCRSSRRIRHVLAAGWTRRWPVLPPGGQSTSLLWQ